MLSGAVLVIPVVKKIRDSGSGKKSSQIRIQRVKKSTGSRIRNTANTSTGTYHTEYWYRYRYF
jgi:hypothetical protein